MRALWITLTTAVLLAVVTGCFWGKTESVNGIIIIDPVPDPDTIRWVDPDGRNSPYALSWDSRTFNLWARIWETQSCTVGFSDSSRIFKMGLAGRATLTPAWQSGDSITGVWTSWPEGSTHVPGRFAFMADADTLRGYWTARCSTACGARTFVYPTTLVRVR